MSATRFLYHANAVGLTLRITRPFEAMLESQAPSALPFSGGYSSARRENIRVRELFSCSSVHTETGGSYAAKHDAFDTFASATAENINLGDVVRAEIITSRVSSSHQATGDVEPSITPLGTAIRTLHVAGQEIQLESFVGHFSRLDTMSKLRAAYQDEPEFRDLMDQTMMRGQKSSLEDRLIKFFPWCHKPSTGELPEFRNTTVLPLFRVLNPNSPGFTVMGNLIDIANFGRVHIGEIIISPYERRINGLHIELGCPVDGETNVSCVSGNGSSTNDPNQ